MKKVLVFICLTLCALIAAGCSQTGDTSSAPVSTAAPDSSVMESQPESAPESAPETASATTLTVRFGDQGAPFTMHLYDNDTAAAIARHVGTADWRLPIYHYDDFENSEVMQYYDIPSRYEIPSNPENITSEKAGEVYYSEPNRIVLFYGDAQVSGEYTPVGYFDATEDFVRAVEENPVLEGWGNKIVQIAPGSDEPEVSQTSVITTEEQEESNMINLQIGEQNLTAELADNSSAQAFADLLARGPITIQMSDYGSFEKVGPLPTSLPENNRQITTEPGDIILYQGNSITVYYDVNTWNFTRLGRVQGVTQQELKDILGKGDVEITFTLSNS
ncbi:cyclophilin-like fold protein [Acutalibacter intestini]|uniref:cyclophilin-like fold protein n=1 Tax=Acutalibacter intestini TaxID=3093659 RepID=UPI002AC9CCA5|nr:cyclophilin-like fold protein [Acutalibacter sp. M00204]